MKLQFNNKKLFLYGITFLYVLILLSLVFALRSDDKDQTPQVVRYNSVSGETADSTPTAPPEEESTIPSPIFSGTSNLLKFGLTLRQLESTSNMFKFFLYQTKQEVKVISVDKDSIKSEPRIDNKYPIIRFSVVFDDTTRYDAKLMHPPDNSVRLELFDTNSKLIFDSGVQHYGVGYLE